MKNTKNRSEKRVEQQVMYRRVCQVSCLLSEWISQVTFDRSAGESRNCCQFGDIGTLSSALPSEASAEGLRDGPLI